MKVVALLTAVLLCSGCGFLAEPRLSGAYAEAIGPADDELIFATWPLHAVMLAGCASVDQSVRTVECVPGAAIDAYNYLSMRGDGNNAIFDRTVFIPWIVSSPVAFAGSYVCRWLAPIENDDRLFEGQLP